MTFQAPTVRTRNAPPAPGADPRHVALYWAMRWPRNHNPAVLQAGRAALESLLAENRLLRNTLRDIGLRAQYAHETTARKEPSS